MCICRRLLQCIVCLNPYSTGSNSNSFVDEATSVTKCLNPYSTGSNSNIVEKMFNLPHLVLILILLEVTQIFVIGFIVGIIYCLNPYSTGSNSNFANDGNPVKLTNVLILILLEVTQMFYDGYVAVWKGSCLNPYSTGSNSNLSGNCLQEDALS